MPHPLPWPRPARSHAFERGSRYDNARCPSFVPVSGSVSARVRAFITVTPLRACFSLYTRLKPPCARQCSRGPASRCLEPSVGASQSGWPRSTACRQPQAGPARQPSCGLRAAGRAHGQPPGVGLGRRPVARGATGWARAVGGKGRLIFLYSGAVWADALLRAADVRRGEACRKPLRPCCSFV